MSNPPIRETLFGDMPLDQWPAEAGADMEPWASFVSARQLLADGKTDAAVAVWRRISDDAALEPRHILQAWHFLRGHGVQPAAEQARALIGVVLEVPVNGGLDLLAAYVDHSARYYNYSGSGVVWEHPNPSLDPKIDALLHAGRNVLEKIGPWDKPRPPAPPAGVLRLNFLSPAGLHFGQGSFQAFANDPIAKPVIEAGVALMEAMLEQSHVPGISD